MREDEDLNIQEYRLSKLYVPASIFALIVAAGYFSFRFIKYYDESFDQHLNLTGITAFSISAVLLLTLFFRFRIKKKHLMILLFFILALTSMLSNDVSLRDDCFDCKGDILVGKTVNEIGFSGFLRNFNKITLERVKSNPNIQNRLIQYGNSLNLNYQKLLDNIDIETDEFQHLSDVDKFRMNRNPPLWFCVIGIWQIFFGDDYFSHIILSNIIAILYLASLYVFLGLFFDKNEYKSKLLIMLILFFLPTFLIQSIRPKNDLILGVLVTWILFFMLKNKKNYINHYDMLIGLYYSIAVLIKFTALALLLPIALYYLINFKIRAIPKLFIVILCFSLLPLFFYFIMGYDMILDFFVGRADQVVITYHSRDIKDVILRRILVDHYYFGVPFSILLITHVLKFRQFWLKLEMATAYMFISFFYMLFIILWGSEVSRHLSGYLPLAVPMLVYIYKNCSEKRKMVFSTVTFLLINNYLILFSRYVDVNTLNKIRWSFW